jgi:uncharacterized protein (TIGR02246 family)
MPTTMTQVDLRAEEQAIRAQGRRYLQGAADKDPAAIASVFAKDGAFLFPGMPLVQGQSALRETFGSLMQTPGFSLTFEPTRIEVAQAGDLAYEVGTYRLQMEPPGGRVDDTGKYVSVWKKAGDKWEMVVDAPSTDLPAPGATGRT